jgi:hypothetical protein
MRRLLVAVPLALSLALVACSGDADEPTATDTTTEAEQPASPTPEESPEEPETPRAEPAEPTWPTDAVSAPFTGTVPPVPMLVEIRAGTHPDEGYDRVALEFEGLPGYRIGYQERIVYDASGAPVDLPGEEFVQFVFNPAQAHDDDGNPTLSGPPVDPVEVGYPALVSYVLNGDFEGYVSVAVGLSAEVGFQVRHFTADNGNDIVYIDFAHP